MDPELTTQLIDKVVDRLELKTLPTEYGRVAMFEATSECPGMHVHFAIEADGEDRVPRGGGVSRVVLGVFSR